MNMDAGRSALAAHFLFTVLCVVAISGLRGSCHFMLSSIHFRGILCCYFMLHAPIPPVNAHDCAVLCVMCTQTASHSHPQEEPESRTNTILFSICFPNWFAFSILVGIVIIIICVIFGLVLRWPVLRLSFFMCIAWGAAAIKRSIHRAIIAHPNRQNQRHANYSQQHERMKLNEAWTH